VNEDVTFTALPNGGSGCSSASFSWNFGDNTSALNGQQGKHKFATDGTYNVVLSITAGSQTVTVPQKVVVGNGSPVTPAAKFDFTIKPIAGMSNAFEFSAFSTPAGAITQWSWDFGDGSSSTLAKVSHAYPDLLNHTVTLTSPQFPGVQVKHDVRLPHRRAAGR
jgi:PKD repeat protein